MDLDDTLRDRLSAAATTTRTRPLPAATTVRRSAERHRAQRRRGAAAVLVAAAATAVALGSTLGPQLLSAPPAGDPTPSVTEQTPAPTTPDPSPTQQPTDGETEAAPPPVVTPEEAQAFVESFRFEGEDEWNRDVDFPATTDTTDRRLEAFGCGGEAAQRGPLAVRTVIAPGPDLRLARQIGVFEDAGTAAETFEELRAIMRDCHSRPASFDDGARVVESTFVGGQLELGDESFWVAQKQVVVAADDGLGVGEEAPWSSGALLVRDGTTVTYIEDPAWTDAGRAEFVENATAEWEALRPQLAPLGG